MAGLWSTGEQLLQTVPRASVLRDGEPESGHGELHAQRVERVAGDFYAVCSCGYVSLPMVSAPASWDCPVADAEAERARNRARLRERLAGL